MKNILLSISFVLITLAGIAGIPSWPKSETAVGYFKISKNPYGVAVYQDGKYASVQFTNARSFTVRGNTITIPSATVVTYGRDDILFDDAAIYTDPPQEQIDYLNKEKVATTTLPHSIYLIDPHVPGMLELRGTDMSLDKNQKQIRGSVTTVIVHDNL
jgi:hypothetical protein